jgi:hypothetical protein
MRRRDIVGQFSICTGFAIWRDHDCFVVESFAGW